MNKMQIIKAATFAAIVSVPAFASAGITESMAEAVTELEKLEVGVEAIGGFIIGLVVTIKGYAVGKRMINRV